MTNEFLEVILLNLDIDKQQQQIAYILQKQKISIFLRQLNMCGFKKLKQEQSMRSNFERLDELEHKSKNKKKQLKLQILQKLFQRKIYQGLTLRQYQDESYFYRI
ncbi:hypothetical protein pb186bvf_010767 [Paramecium bursaria]